MKKVLWVYCATSVLLILSCSNKGNTPSPQPSTTTPSYTAPTVSATFAKGADVSWVTQMEASGVKFYDKNGNQQDLFVLMKSLGFNSIRLRAWVNPSAGWCNTADVVAKAKRAVAAGLSVMIDFHYSDTWADPGDQNKPAAWTSYNTSTLIDSLYSYTYSTLSTLKSNGITPTWVQIGNETSNGMLWTDGEASLSSTNFQNFANMITNGYNAVKAVFPSAKVIVHLANGYDNTTYRWMFDGLKTYGAKWDIIGMSLYPSTTNWQTLDTQCLANINDMVSRYSTPCMIVEVGMEETAASTARDFLTDIITKVNGVNSGNGLGVFYWEPEAYNWQSYGLGAFDNTGKPTEALDAFGN